ncbi:MAG TPA: M48 family metallopeptidase [Paludibacteraceae bacterium]|nr:M48 family metallopeptidase [Paludibacteraceae bacterium]
MAQTLFIIILIIVVFNYLFGLLLDYLDSTLWSNVLPKELNGIYDAEKYRKSQDYEKVNTRFSLITGAFSFILLILMLVLGGFAWLDNFVRSYASDPIIIALLFFAVLGLTSDLLTTPFSAYHTFVIEQKFGFNTTTVKTFILDKLKSWLLAAVLGGGILTFIVWVYGNTGSWFWFVAWMALTGFSIFMTLFYSNIIVPLFNKQKPLEAGDLRDAIEAFAIKTGFKLKNIFVINGSKRSKKANAYFTGFGPKKRIVLYDTLLNDFTNDEIVSILAHETGHYKKKHVLYGLLTSIISSGVLLYIMSLVIGSPDVAGALGAGEASFHMGILAFGMLYSPVSMILGIAGNYISRRHEYAADHYAAIQSNTDAMISGLKKLHVLSLSNLRPHPFTVFITYSHPTLLQRIAALNKS